MRIRTARTLLLSFALSTIAAQLALAQSVLYPVPDEVRTDRFTMTVDRHPAGVTHAAANYSVASFDLHGSAKISITAATSDFWAKGVEVQPWRWGIRPTIKGRTISFTVSQPMELSITRPGDHLAKSEMFFLFANQPEVDAPKPGDSGIRYYGPGIHREFIDVKSGEKVYLAPGAVILGGINIWGSENVKVYGRGMVIYDGPQDPDSDTGWMHKPNWHVIVMDKARNVEIDGITCIVRSRTWMIQMLDSHQVSFNNVKVIGGSPGNANQDGMDFLGGGDTVVRDTFIRAADDIFAAYGNWLGYGKEALATPGIDIANITVENSVLSTSISNVVRIGWPQKVTNNQNFTLRDSDVIHMGIGGCKVPFALLEVWADPDGSGTHSNYRFENIRMEDWYSLVQLRQQKPKIRDVSFREIFGLEHPSMVPSVLSGDIGGVSFDHVKLGGTVAKSASDVPLDTTPETPAPEWKQDLSEVHSAIAIRPRVVRPGQKVTLDASASAATGGKIVSYEWTFGDGTSAKGRIVQHAFPDTEGTLRDGSGRFRVLLKATDDHGNIDWTYQPVIVAKSLSPAEKTTAATPGLNYRYYEGNWPEMPDFSAMPAIRSGETSGLIASVSQRADNFAVVYSGFLDVPADGGYTFTLLSRDGGKLEIGSQTVAVSPVPFPQVCGAIGNSVQPATGSLALKAGKHPIRVTYSKSTGENNFALRWEGPAKPASEVPDSALSH